MADNMDTAKENAAAPDTGDRAKFWLEELSKAGKREKEWRTEGTKIVKRYRADVKNRRSYNILYANTELLKPTILSRTPKVDVRQRHLADENPEARQAGEILERAVNYAADDPSFFFTENLEKARDDMLLPGRGVVRIVYERDIRRRELFREEDELGDETFTLDGEVAVPDEIDDEGNGFREDITRQDVFIQYIYWKDYREGDARVWEDVPWVAFRHLMTRKELKEQFGDIAKTVPLPVGKDSKSQNIDDNEPEAPTNRAIVWEVWNKEKKQRVWIAEGFHEAVLDTEDDPLNIQNFYPMPEPLRSIKTTDSRIPIPEFRIYKDQADELDMVTMRIEKLIEALKARGFYAAILSEVKDLYSSSENTLIPVENWGSLKDLGGLKGAIEFTDIQQYANVLVSLYQQRKELKQEIFEITGLSDIIRGTTDPRETATAQSTKAQFGTMRLNPRQTPMERFIRTIFRIEAEIVAEHFTPEHIESMTGLSPSLEVMQLLRDDKVRSYNVDVETDTTVVPDEQKEQAQVTDYLSASSQFIAAAAQAAQTAPQMAPLFLEMFRAASRRFKMGRELEDKIDESIKSLKEAQEQAANAPPEPDPEVEKANAEMQLKQQQAQADAMLKQADMELKKVELEADAQLKIQAAEQQAAMKIREIEARSQLERMKIAETSELEREKQAALNALEREKQDAEFSLKQRSAELEMQLKRDIAELDAKTRRDDMDSRRGDLEIRRESDSAAQGKQTEQKPVVVNLNIPEASKRKITLQRDGDGKLEGAEVNEA